MLSGSRLIPAPYEKAQAPELAHLDAYPSRRSVRNLACLTAENHTEIFKVTILPGGNVC